MQKQKKTLSMQDCPGNSSNPCNSHCSKTNWRKICFQIAFKILETLAIVLQIVQFLCEMFKK